MLIFFILKVGLFIWRHVKCHRQKWHRPYSLKKFPSVVCAHFVTTSLAAITSYPNSFSPIASVKRSNQYNTHSHHPVLATVGFFLVLVHFSGTCVVWVGFFLYFTLLSWSFVGLSSFRMSFLLFNASLVL
jgi:hypothetical protein